jgi:MutS-like protein
VPDDPRPEYSRRVDRWSAEIARTDRAHLVVSNLRLATVIGGAVVFWLAFIRSAVPSWSIVAPLAVFAALAVKHARILQLGERARRARRFYQRGLDRMADRWAGSGRDGVRFLDGHPFARDLDLFGRGSLFELMNTARTDIGEETLAGWLRAPAGCEEATARQAAVDELRAMLDLREDVAVLAAESEVGRTGPLAAWTAAAAQDLPRALAFVLPSLAAVTAVLSVLVYRETVAAGWLIAWVCGQSAIAAIWRHRFHHALHAVETPEHDLALLASLLERVERERFTSVRLAALRQALITDGVPPSRRIAQLRSLVSWLDSTHNLMFAPFAYLLLVREQLAVAINNWHRAYGGSVGDWLRVVGDLEALVAIATYAYEHPADPFPAIVAGAPLFDAASLGHPLLAESMAVRNDLSLGGRGSGSPQVLVVSGSNMSGKSTLLRAVGVNVVLALAGAPVRAARVRLSPLAIGATLRIEDSLQEGHSRFYTEILRIRTIVDLTAGALPVLFLLDEILHGTNSHDRRIGAEAIVRALAARGAIGLVTTHDLALTELTKTMGPAAANVHFEDRIEDGAMVFDYRMRPGVVERSNALALMRAVGLDV